MLPLTEVVRQNSSPLVHGHSRGLHAKSGKGLEPAGEKRSISLQKGSYTKACHCEVATKLKKQDTQVYNLGQLNGICPDLGH